MKRFTILFWAALAAMIMAGCQEEGLTPEEQARVDLVLIEDYVAENNLQGEYLDSDVFVSITKEGTGTESPTVTNIVEVVYKGYLLDGTVFDSSDGFPTRAFMGNLIEGWRIGMEKYVEGT